MISKRVTCFFTANELTKPVYGVHDPACLGRVWLSARQSGRAASTLFYHAFTDSREIRYEDELHLEDLHWEIGCVWTRLVDATKLSTTIRYMIDDISTTIRMALSSRWSSFLGAF